MTNSVIEDHMKDLFDELSKNYTFLEETDFSGQKTHEFRDYITNPKFVSILKEFKLAK